MLPYRWPAVAARVDADETCPDGDLLAPFLVFWIGSLARVALAIAHGEHAGSEVTLAFLTAIGVPLLLRHSVAWWFSHLRRRPR